MEKKRIALVSFFKSESYGAILQCLGLQRVLQQNGFDPLYLDYERKINLPFSKRVINLGYQLVRRFFGYARRYKRTTFFKNQYLNTSQLDMVSSYALYIVGSDQVWLPENVNDFFLLNFVKDGRKMSYASSFGVSSLPDHLIDYYRLSLSSFNAISTREHDGKQILSRLGFNDVRVVLDPTMLLTKEEWLIYAKLPKYDRRYILCYVMSGDDVTTSQIKRIAKCLAERKRLPILTIGDKEYKVLIPGNRMICDAGPSEFLGYIHNADYIITSSFHGTCFSILFKKNFINVLRPDNPVNCRIEELDKKLGLETRLHYTNSIDYMPDFSSIDYSVVESKLSLFRNDSLGFLLNTINRLTD